MRADENGLKIGYCGIVCSCCPAYVLSRKGQVTAQRRIAKLWSDGDHEYQACDIVCKGCTEVWGKKFGHCEDCKVRECARKRMVENCGVCEEYPCGLVRELYERLDARIVRKRFTRRRRGRKEINTNDTNNEKHE